MGKRVKILIGIVILVNSVFSQGLLNRFRTPIMIKSVLGIGYDNNYLRLSENEINQNELDKLGITSTVYSQVLKPRMKLIYSPVLVNGKQTNFVSSISYAYYTKGINKSYYIYNLSFELKMAAYSWIKLGLRDVPNYYLRNYIDRDLLARDYIDCSFASRKFYVSYSFPVKKINKFWIRFYSEKTSEYYNVNFTEFDLNKHTFLLNFNKNFKRFKIKLALAHGKAINISYDSKLSSTNIDRSYIFDKIRFDLEYKIKKIDIIKNIGLLAFFEQRYYDLNSKQLYNENWKYYFDGQTKLWLDWKIFKEIGCKSYFLYRWRNATSQVYGDFDWVDNIKSYSKYEFWIEFSYDFTLDFLY